MDTKQIKVVLGVPVADNDAMRALTAQAIGAMIIASEGKVTNFFLRRSCDITSNRTWLVKQALEDNATHLLFIDSDMLFAPDTLNKLLAYDKDIISVEYNKRTFPLERVSEPVTERSETDIYQVKYAGTGLMLIKTDVFKNPELGKRPDGLRNPWFNFGRGSEGQATMGEDVWFCNVARDAGYEIWIDPTIKMGHIGEYIF